MLSSASARRNDARHFLHGRMSGGVIPATTGSRAVGVDQMHPDTRQRLCVVLCQVCVCGYCVEIPSIPAQYTVVGAFN